MSSALCVCIHASETGHAGGVPIAPSRGRSVEVPFGREVLFLFVFVFLGVCCHFKNKQKNRKFYYFQMTVLYTKYKAENNVLCMLNMV